MKPFNWKTLRSSLFSHYFAIFKILIPYIEMQMWPFARPAKKKVIKVLISSMTFACWGHSVITLALRGGTEVHQNANKCKPGEKESHVSTKVFLQVFLIEHLVTQLLTTIIRFFVSSIKIHVLLKMFVLKNIYFVCVWNYRLSLLRTITY